MCDSTIMKAVETEERRNLKEKILEAIEICLDQSERNMSISSCDGCPYKYIELGTKETDVDCISTFMKDVRECLKEKEKSNNDETRSVKQD